MSLELDNKITTGNLVTIATMLIAGGVAWGTMNNKIDAVTARTEALETLIAARTSIRDQQLASQEARIRTIEIAQAGQTADLRAIQVGISRIETKLDRLEARP